ncbi:unnamed protein product [Urochloa humidicola]
MADIKRSSSTNMLLDTCHEGSYEIWGVTMVLIYIDEDQWHICHTSSIIVCSRFTNIFERRCHQRIYMCPI